MKTIVINIPEEVDEKTFKKIVEGIANRLLKSKKRLKELDEILGESKLTDDDAVELGRLLKRRAREKGWY